MTADRQHEIVTAYLAGEHMVSLADRFHVAHATIYSILDEAGVPRKRPRMISPTQRDEIRALYAAGKTPKEIAAIVGHPRERVRSCVSNGGMMRKAEKRPPRLCLGCMCPISRDAHTDRCRACAGKFRRERFRAGWSIAVSDGPKTPRESTKTRVLSMFQSGIPQTVIAEHLGVSRRRVNQIVRSV